MAENGSGYCGNNNGADPTPPDLEKEFEGKIGSSYQHDDDAVAEERPPILEDESRRESGSGDPGGDNEPMHPPHLEANVTENIEEHDEEQEDEEMAVAETYADYKPAKCMLGTFNLMTYRLSKRLD